MVTDFETDFRAALGGASGFVGMRPQRLRWGESLQEIVLRSLPEGFRRKTNFSADVGDDVFGPATVKIGLRNGQTAGSIGPVRWDRPRPFGRGVPHEGRGDGTRLSSAPPCTRTTCGERRPDEGTSCLRKSCSILFLKVEAFDAASGGRRTRRATGRLAGLAFGILGAMGPRFARLGPNRRRVRGLWNASASAGGGGRRTALIGGAYHAFVLRAPATGA